MPRPDWSDWVSAADTYQWCAGDPLIDWLNADGTAAGFVADSRRPAYDRRFDYLSFVVRHSWAFKRTVLRGLSAYSPLRTIATSPRQVRDPAKMQQTLEAMKQGVAIIAGAVLWNPDDRMAGMVDLLVRSDLLAQLVPAAFAGESPDAPTVAAPALGGVAYHYRAIDLKFMTLHLLKDGCASAEHLPHMVQNWIYNQALGKMQGYTPLASYLVGRDQFQAAVRVNHADPELGRLAAEAAAWIRRLRQEGATWKVLPVPSIAELRPNMKAERDQEWHAAKREIALAQFDLTLLPYVGPERRAHGAAAGITRWDDPALSARTLGFGDSTEGRRVDTVLAANRSSGKESVLPVHLASNIGGWQQAARLECFVRVESVNDQDDDFNELPERGGTAMFFMITFGLVDGNGQWQSGQLIARDLSRPAETALRMAWQAELTRLAESRGIQPQDIRLFHWGPIPPTLRALPPPLAGEGREGDWFDLLENLIYKEPVTVRGAFNFGLAEMARAFHTLGLVETALPSGPPGTLAAMAGAWWSAREAKRLGVDLDQVDAMQLIGRFSQAACRSMAEILALLRQHASAALPEAA